MRAAIVAAALLVAAPAAAFHEVGSFERTANTGGGAGYYFTGSSRSKGYDCGICHTGAAGRIAIELQSNPPELAQGSYEPGVVYSLTVRLHGEHRGLASAFNPNTFTAEVVGDDGAALGAFAVTVGSVMRLRNDGQLAIAEGFGRGETEWDMRWTAPDTPVPATFHLGMLDGDGAGLADVRFIDPINDDVAVLALRLCPTGQTCPAAEPPPADRSAVQCSSSGDAGGGAWLAAALVLLSACRGGRGLRSRR